MDNWLQSFGGFARDVAGAAGTVANAFQSGKQEDIKTVEAKEAWNWRPIAIALGGVVVVAIVLKLAFRK